MTERGLFSKDMSDGMDFHNHPSIETLIQDDENLILGDDLVRFSLFWTKITTFELEETLQL